MWRCVAGTLVAFLVAGCAGGGQLGSSASRPVPASELRDLSDEEKRVIAAGVAAGLRGQPASNFQWARFPREAPPSGTVQYCAKAGGRPFIATVTVTNGRASAANLIAIGGAYIEGECRRYYETPFS